MNKIFIHPYETTYVNYKGKEKYNYEDPRRIEQPIQSQIPQNYNAPTNPMDGNGYEPDPIGEGYGYSGYESEDQPIMNRNKQEESKSLWGMIRGMF